MFRRVAVLTYKAATRASLNSRVGITAIKSFAVAARAFSTVDVGNLGEVLSQELKVSF